MTPAAAGHRIRLRGPWTIARRDDADQEFAPAVVHRHPEDWPQVVNHRSGRARLTRTFHAPSNLDESETVFVVLTGVYGDGNVWLNNRHLGSFSRSQHACRFAVPFALPFSNELTIDVAFPAPTDAEPQVGVYDVVALDIRSAAP